MQKNTLKMSKKGMTVGDMLPFIMIFITTAIAIGLGSQVLSEMKTAQDDDVANFGNTTLNWAGNNTASGFGVGRVVSSTVLVYNNGTPVNQGANWSLSGEDNNFLVITNQSTSGKVGSQSEWITSKINVSYSYNYGSSAYNATSQGLTAQNTFAKWLPTIALVIMIAIVIGILILYLANRVGGIGGMNV